MAFPLTKPYGRRAITRRPAAAPTPRRRRFQPYGHPRDHKNAAMEISPVQAVFTQAKAAFDAQGKAAAAQTMERVE